MKVEISFHDLCKELGNMSASGRVSFKSPFYKLVCDMLGIKYTNLSIKGKRILHEHCATTYMSFYNKNYLLDGEYYVNI